MVQRLAVFRNHFFAGGKLKRIDVPGGPALTLCDAAQPRGGAWGSRGVIVFNAANTGPLMRVPAGGGTPTPATQPDPAIGETSHRWPSFLPDGRHFLYLARANDRDKSVIWVGDLESKTRHRVTNGASNAAFDPRGFVLFMRETTLIAQPFDAGRLESTGEAFPVAEQGDFSFNNSLGHFSISQTGTLVFYSGGASNVENLTWLDRTGKPLGTVGPPGIMLQPAISPDGATVAVERQDPQTGTNDIWLHDIAHATDSRFTFDPGNDGYATWSPDGSRILFSSNRTARWGLYTKPASGTGKEEMLFESPGSLSESSCRATASS